MEGLGFARSKEYWIRFGWGVLIGFVAALGVLGFNIVMSRGLTALWPDVVSAEPFSGSIWIVVILTIAGFIVGVIHQFTSAEDVDAVTGIVSGKIKTRPIPSALLASLVSLVGGFSVGPEVPSGMIGGGFAQWVSDRRNHTDETRKSNITSGIVSAYSGLFTAPMGSILIPIELPHRQSLSFYGNMVIAAVAAMVGFLVFFVVGNDQFAGLLRLLDLPTYSLLPWHVVLAIPLGILGGLLAATYGLSMGVLKRLVKPLNRMPILRNTLAGFLLGLLGYALPLTLFLGSDGLVTVTENAAEIGVALLIVYIFAKILATSGAISTGFIGGPIFPLFFVGGTAGTVISMVFPQIPVGLSVGSMMAAVPAGILPIPLSLGVYAMLIAGLPITEGVPVLLAGLISFLITKGLIGRSHKKAPPVDSGE